MSNNRYMMRGVSAAKEDVHNAIKNIDKGIFPQAFCKIIPDILGGDPEYCNIMHADRCFHCHHLWNHPGIWHRRINGSNAFGWCPIGFIGSL